MDLPGWLIATILVLAIIGTVLRFALLGALASWWRRHRSSRE